MAHIIYAGYGAGNRTLDVTEIAAGYYQSGGREFRATNDFGDPAPGEQKCLFLVWSQGGALSSGVTSEGDEEPIIIP